MKPKELIVFEKVKNLYCPHIEICLYQGFCHSQLKLIANSISPEHYHIIVNAANKFYELVALND